MNHDLRRTVDIVFSGGAVEGAGVALIEQYVAALGWTSRRAAPAISIVAKGRGKRPAPDLIVAILQGRSATRSLRAAALLARRHLTPMIVVDHVEALQTALDHSWLTRVLVGRSVTQVVSDGRDDLLKMDDLRVLGLPPKRDLRGVAALAIEDLPLVVSIHRRAFPDSATTHLGDQVIDRYYRWQFVGNHPHPHASGYWDDGVLVGFLVGGLRRDAVSGFARRFLLSVLLGCLTHPKGAWLLTGPKVLPVLRLMTRRGRATPRPPDIGIEAGDQEAIRQASSPSFGVLSIAVHPVHQGSGAAIQLMRHAERAAQDLGVERMHLTVDVTNTRAIRFYEREGWQRSPGSDGAWHGKMIKDLATPHLAKHR